MHLSENKRQLSKITTPGMQILCGVIQLGLLNSGSYFPYDELLLPFSNLLRGYWFRVGGCAVTKSGADLDQ